LHGEVAFSLLSLSTSSLSSPTPSSSLMNSTVVAVDADVVVCEDNFCERCDHNVDHSDEGGDIEDNGQGTTSEGEQCKNKETSYTNGEQKTVAWAVNAYQCMTFLLVLVSRTDDDFRGVEVQKL
jgi:hypothetical protein